jgi:S1-C subfamily serine protease
MASLASLRSILRAGGVAAAFAVAGLLAVAPPALAASAQSVADTRREPPAADAQYQRLVRAAKAVVAVKVHALPDARSNETLGRDRNGSGVVIADDGLELTIGYLVQEADQVSVTDSDGQTVPAAVVGYDDATGFGLVRPLGRLAAQPIRMGSSAPIAQLDRLMIVSGGEGQSISIATVVAKRRFAGYWEYLIDDAIFTVPPRLDHSGAALVNQQGELVGIGSLFVMDAMQSDQRIPGNMFVPIDLLKPALGEMLRSGEQEASHRPWLGVDSLEEDGRVKVMDVSAEGPAAKAGLKAGDIILSVDGEPVDRLPKLYRRVWSAGPPGTEVRLTVLQGVAVHDIDVHSIDHQEFVRHKTGI